MPSVERGVFSNTWCEGQNLPFHADMDLDSSRDAENDDRTRFAQRLGEIEGAFAVAFTDENGHLHLARDGVGHRSLYWGVTRNGALAFSTRLAPLLTLGVPRQLDSVAIAMYLSTAYVPGTRTLVSAVRSVPPGVELIFSHPTRAPKEKPFWTLPATPQSFESEDTLHARLRSTLDEAVARAVSSETHVGAFLSGGIDSSLVVALAQRLRPVKAFSISFGPEHRNELEWSQQVAQHTGAEHHVVTVRPEDVRARLDLTVSTLSEPNGDPLTVPNQMMFEAAARAGLSVVVNGEGGDPCFGGPKNSPMLLSELYGGSSREAAYYRAHQKLWDELETALEPEFLASLLAAKQQSETIESTIPSVHPERSQGAEIDSSFSLDSARGERDVLSAKSAATTGSVFPQRHITEILEAHVTPWLQDARWPSYLERLLAINVAWKGSGHILPKVEHLGGRMGVTARSPLFDRRVVEMAFALPTELKRKGSIEKYLLKEAVRDLLPTRVVERPKSGMMVPVEGWFTGPLADFAKERLLDGLLPWRIVRRDYLEQLVARQLPGLRPRQGVKLWLLLTLESWLRTVYKQTR